MRQYSTRTHALLLMTPFHNRINDIHHTGAIVEGGNCGLSGIASACTAR